LATLEQSPDDDALNLSGTHAIKAHSFRLPDWRAGAH